MKAFRPILFSVVLASVNLYAAFETFDDFDARARAIGNANAAIPVSSSVMLGNPALLSMMPRSLLEVTFLPRGVGLVDTASSPLVNASVGMVSAMKGAGSLGVGLNALLVTSEGTTTYSEYQVSVGYGVRVPGTKIGLGGTLMLQSWNLGATPSLPLPSDIGTSTSILPTVNGTFGVHFLPSEQLSIGFVGKNLVHLNLALLRSGSTNTDYVNRSGVLGVAYTINRFVIALDSEFVIDTSQVNLRFGGETWFAQRRVHVGAGFEMQGPTRGLVPSIGMGVNAGPFVVDYAFAYPLNLPGIGNHMLSLTLVLP